MVNIVVNVGTTTSTVVRNTLYGVATNEMQMNGFQPNPKFEAATSTLFQSLCSQLTIPFLRFNWDNDRPSGAGLASGPIMTGIFPSRGAAPDWTWIDNFYNNAGKFLNTSTCVQMICHGAPSWLNLSTASDRTLLGQQVVQLAQHIKAKGFPCYLWETFNEVNGLNDMTDQVASAVAVATALAGYADGTGNVHKVCGPSDDFPYTDRVSSFVQGMGNRIGAVTWHRYSSGATSSESATANLVDASNWGPNLAVPVQNAASSFVANVPQGVTEHNVSFNGSDFDNGSYVAAVHGALTMQSLALSGTNFQYGAIWELFGDSNFGIIPTNSANTAPAGSIRPHGYTMSQCARWMPGTQFVTGGTTTNLAMLCTQNGSDYTIQMINFGSSAINVSISVQGVTQAASYNYWEIGSNFQTTPHQTTISSLTNLTIAPVSVVMLSTLPFAGSSVPVPVPVPTPSPVPGITPSDNGTTVPPFSSIIGVDGTQWTILADGTIGVNGNSDGQSANVIELAYIDNNVWQKNSSNLWWFKSVPSDVWSPGSGTSTDPTIGVAEPPLPTPPGPSPTPTPTPSPTPGPSPSPSPPPAPATGSQIVLGLNTPTGTVSPFIWGVGTEGLDSPGVNDFAAAVNSGWQATYRNQNWRLFRFNTEGTLADWTNTSSTPKTNWKNGTPNFWTNVGSSSDVSKNRLVFTLGSSGNNPTPAQAVSIAQYFKSVGTECFYWEFWNEPDGSDASTYATQFGAVKTALKNFNADYKVGGPTTSFSRTDFLSALQSHNPDFISYHTYFTGGYNDNVSLFAAALARQKNDIGLVRQFFSNTPIFLGEWNIDFNGTENFMQTIDGAIFGALYTTGAYLIDSGVQMGAVWTIGENSNFTFVNNDGSNIRPMGHMLGQSGRIMGGTRVFTSTGAAIPKVLALASVTSTTYSVMMINYDTQSAAINLLGLPAQNATYWELSPAHTTPSTLSKAVTSNTSMTLPSRSIVTLTGALPPVVPPPSPPPAPTPTPPPPTPPPAPPPAPTRAYWQIPGGDGSKGTLGGPSVWVTPLGSGASWGLDTDSDTIALRNGGSINASLAQGDVLWQGSGADPLTTFVTAPDAYQRDPALAATLHVPIGAYAPGPQFGSSFGRNAFNAWDISGNPGKTWSFVNISPTMITGNQTVSASVGETDDPTSDHYAEDQETRNFGYDGIAGLLTAYDFDPAQNSGYPKIQHMLRYLHSAEFLMSGNPVNGDTLGVNSWPQLKQDAQNVVPYTGHLKAGTTVGIPATVTMPSGLTTEGQMLWHCLQTYGALWRGSCPGGFHLSATQDVSSSILANLNRDLPTIVQFLRPLRNQHIGGQPFTSSPKNGPGTRLDTGPPLLSSSGTPVAAPAPVSVTIGQVVASFSAYWKAMSDEVVANQDLLFGFVVNSGDRQGSSGVPDVGVLNTDAAALIGTNFGPVKKG